ncbi:MAG: hypothetical protein LBD54_00935 [Puniceicoccales bacterium]|jgi:hypothetical protein|nr:hypothetical protein [Puniceicoccales bacterium]
MDASGRLGTTSATRTQQLEATSGLTNTSNVFQKSGHCFFQLAGTAGGGSVQDADFSTSEYKGEVGQLQQEITQSATKRPLKERIRDPHNHTAKTQILQLAQLATQENRLAKKEGEYGTGGANEALLALMRNPNTKLLVTSALASAMEGASWVAERETKIGEGVLSTNTLAADAIRACVLMDRKGFSKSKDIGKVFSKLQSHGALNFTHSNLGNGLQKLRPKRRLEFYRLAHASGQQPLPPIQDFVVGKAKTTPKKFFAAISGEKDASGKKNIENRLDFYRSICKKGLKPPFTIQDFVVGEAKTTPKEFFAAISKGASGKKDIENRLDFYKSICKRGLEPTFTIQDFVVGKAKASQDECFAAVKGMDVKDRVKLYRFIRNGTPSLPAPAPDSPAQARGFPVPIRDFVAAKAGATEEEFFAVVKDMDVKDRVELGRFFNTSRYPEGSSASVMDVVAGKQNARPDEFWDVALKVSPIKVGEKEIDSYRALQEQVITPMENIVRQEVGISQAVRTISAANGPQDASTRMHGLNAQMNALLSLPTPDGASVNQVRSALNALAKNFGVVRHILPDERASGKALFRQPKGFAQGQMLNVMKKLGELIPEMKLRCNSGTPDTRNISSQLRDAVTDVQSYFRKHFGAREAEGSAEKAFRFFEKLGIDSNALKGILVNADELAVPLPPNPTAASTPTTG